MCIILYFWINFLSLFFFQNVSQSIEMKKFLVTIYFMSTTINISFHLVFTPKILNCKYINYLVHKLNEVKKPLELFETH